MSRITMLSVVCLLGSSVLAAPPPPTPPVTLESLLREMVDREAVARWPEPSYTCKQFSSYDRASKSPKDEKGWFAKAEVSQFLRVVVTGGGGAGARNG